MCGGVDGFWKMKSSVLYGGNIMVHNKSLYKE